MRIIHEQKLYHRCQNVVYFKMMLLFVVSLMLFCCYVSNRCVVSVCQLPSFRHMVWFHPSTSTDISWYMSVLL